MIMNTEVFTTRRIKRFPYFSKYDIGNEENKLETNHRTVLSEHEIYMGTTYADELFHSL